MKFHHIPDLPLSAFCPEPGGRLSLYKGGSSGGAEKYDNLEKLYKVQTDNANLLLQQAQRYLPGATAQYMNRVAETQGGDYAEKQANQARADMAKANAMERSATSRDLKSMGVNPNDPRFARGMQSTELSNAARMAAGVNAMRDQAKRYQLAVSQDALGTMTGTNNTAASQLGNATSGLTNLYNTQQNAKAQQDQMRSQNVGNAVGGAFSLLMSKDGGKVRSLERHFVGGPVGGGQGGGFTGGAMSHTPSTPPLAGASARQGSEPVAKMIKAGGDFFTSKGNNLMNKMQLKGQNVMNNFGKAAEFFGAPQAGEIQAYSSGMGMSADQAVAAREAYFSASQTARATGDLSAASQYEQMGNSIANGAGLDSLSATYAGQGLSMAPGGGITGLSAATGAEATGALAGVSEAGAAAGTVGAGAAELGAGAASLGQGLSAGAGVAGMAGAGGAGTAATGMAAMGELGAGLSAGAGATAGGVAAGAAGAGASALTTGLGAVATALPWVGAAVGIGSLLGLFKDGGEVNALGSKARDLRNGGKVNGPGDHTADLVPALLSDQENVINAEAAVLVGHDTLNRLNKKGLALRHQGKRLDQIKTIGLEALQ